MTAITNIDFLAKLEETVRRAVEEDVGSGDISALLVPENKITSATLITRESAIFCGKHWVAEVFKQIDSSVELEWLVDEGKEVVANQELLKIKGKARSILTAERTAMNFLQTLMATATSAKKYSLLLEGKDTQILDTRKTIPGLRLAQKYAVKVGGANNHRIGLYDAFLIKENHIAACGNIHNAVSQARVIAPEAPVEVEVETLKELEEAMDAGANRIMLDNFSPELLKQAVYIKTPEVEFEISGNITEENLIRLPLDGIDFISSGAITKNIQAIDLSLRID